MVMMILRLIELFAYYLHTKAYENIFHINTWCTVTLHVINTNLTIPLNDKLITLSHFVLAGKKIDNMCYDKSRATQMNIRTCHLFTAPF
jgi:hypothetical protein